MIAVLPSDSLANSNIALVDRRIVLKECTEKVVIRRYMQCRVKLWSLYKTLVFDCDSTDGTLVSFAIDTTTFR